MRRRTGSASLLLDTPIEVLVGGGVLLALAMAALGLMRRYRDAGPVGGYPDFRRRSD